MRLTRSVVLVGLIHGFTSAALAGQEPPPPPRDLSVAHVQGQAVTLAWIHATPAAPPDGYIVEGGLTPGDIWATAALAGTATSATFTLANGIYFARLRAIHDGVPTASSNEVEVVVGALRAPSAPDSLAALAIGSDVALSWRHTYAGGAPADVLVDVTGPVQATFALPASGHATFPAVPRGSYSVTLRARNAAGVSGPSSPLTLTVPGGSLQVVQSPAQAFDAARLPVRYEDFTAPRLAEFAAREQLGSVLQGLSSEFEGILRLKDWVAAQWPNGLPDPYPPWDAMTILDWIRSGRTGGFCGQYSQVFLQALAAFGVPARYVGVGLIDNPLAHFTTEVWSNDFNKWVLIDVFFNVHYERDGIPQSVLEIHEAFVHRNDAELVVVPGQVREGHPSATDYPHRATEFFYYQFYQLKANHVSVPLEPPANLYEDTVEWLDDRTVPWELSTVPSEFPHIRATRVRTGDRALVEWRPNQVWITPRRTGPMQYTLDLQHTVLQLGRFEYRVIDQDGVVGAWQSQASPQITWTIGPRDRRLEVRGMNVRGIAGPVSAVAIVP